jgi:hypothetical protein
VNKSKNPAGLRILAQVAAGQLIWAITFVIANRTLHSGSHSLALRIAMVMLGVGGFLPWLISLGRLIMAQDEFSQRLHLVALALTCGATATLVLTGHFLQTAGLIGDVSLQSIWLGMGVVWWLSIMFSAWYYR